MRLAILLFLVLANAAVAAAETRAMSRDAMMEFINGYRQRPRPELLPDVLHAMSANGLLEDQETAGVYVGFIAGVLGDNQLEARYIVSRMFPLKPDEQVTMIRAIAYSGLPDWKLTLGSFAALMPTRAFLIEKHASGALPGLLELPLEEPRTLDTLWGYYIATGRYEPVQRVIEALAWAGDSEEVTRLTAGSIAKWTLASNGARDENLLALFRTELGYRDEPIRGPLMEVLAAAQTYELGPLRKEALAAIEELKVKGPESARRWAWAAQAGTTAIALGCVAASVAGQAQLGIPCIVTGAVTQAAGKLLTAP